MRQRFIAAMQPSQEIFVSAAAPQGTNATIALTIAKAEAQYAEILAHIRAAEATIAKLTEASAAARVNQPLPLTFQEAGQINNIFIVIKEQLPVPTRPPTAEVNEAPTKLNSFIDHLKKYADNFFTEVSKSAGKTVGKAIPIGSIIYLLIDQLTALSNLISDWLSGLRGRAPG